MKLHVPLAAFAALALTPVAASSHAACGPQDGDLVTNALRVWLLPGCQGGAVWVAGSCSEVVHADVMKATVVVLGDGCTIVGVWLRP